jgi:hypothetical protein
MCSVRGWGWVFEGMCTELWGDCALSYTCNASPFTLHLRHLVTQLIPSNKAGFSMFMLHLTARGGCHLRDPLSRDRYLQRSGRRWGLTLRPRSTLICFDNASVTEALA